MMVVDGDGKVGKSTAALAVGTVLGFGGETHLPTWNITGAALPERAQCFNHLPLVLNGLESMKMKEGELSDIAREGVASTRG